MTHCDHIGVTILAALMSFGLAIFLVYDPAHDAGVAKGRQEARAAAMVEARQVVEAEMREKCVCWFNDSRCTAPRPIVVCHNPSFMRND